MAVVRGIKCPRCGDVLWSKGRHNHIHCTCKGSFVDGGQESMRIGGLAAKDINALITIQLQDRDSRIWESGGQYLSHRQMTTDHLKNCITHLHDRIERSLEDEELGYTSFEDKDELRRIIDEMKEELAWRDVYNIPGEVH